MRSQFHRVDYLHVLERRAELFAVLAQHAQGEEQQRRNAAIQSVWNTYHSLASLTMQDRVIIKEEEWQQLARAWGKQFLTCYMAEDVTPYMHLFVYHMGYYLEQ